MAQKIKVGGDSSVDEALPGGKGLEIEAEVQRMELREGDVIVVRCQERIRPEFAVYLQKMIRREFPEHQVIVVDGGIELQVLADPADREE